MSHHLIPTYAQLPVTFRKGEGVWLWDTDNKKYLDALSGIAVCSLGHCHPKVTAAIQQQASTLVHTSNLYHIEAQEKLSDDLIRLSKMHSVFFCNSGTEANEAAIKIARLYGTQKKLKSPKIIVMENSFHGRTFGAMSATGNKKIQQGFEPLVEGFICVKYNDVNAIQQIIEQHDDVVAILVEPVQGEGGVNIPADDYLTALRQICDEHQLLLMLDEIQTGMARTGKMFAHQHNEITPDVMTLAKALGNGFPIGACIVANKASDVFSPGKHGTTFGGNPLACCVAQTVIEIMETENLAKNALTMGQTINDTLSKKLHGIDIVQNIRNKGLMIGIELSSNCQPLVQNALAKGLLINVTAEKVIRLLPPLTLTKANSDQIIDILVDIITQQNKQISL
ncbi:MAG: aspartate aminotransferase family protein [Methylococcales bacterium]|jgi:acetylornithine/N-succinyldiaminopimelate aminotransferase|nr:aspartate aminotransferase family protein [Methylococcales bacterium]MBT7409632.1 aspartate aminotransferase family protein [Methylococcales bacterium]